MFFQVFSLIFAFTFCIHSILPAGPQKITIVGAGLAGLTAAHRLNQEGYDVDVYEARGRPGGRAFTVRYGNAWEELGGKFLDCGNTADCILALMQEFGIEAITQNAKNTTHYVYQGEVASYHSQFLKYAPQPIEKYHSFFKKQCQQAESLGDFLDFFCQGQQEFRHMLECKEKFYEGANTHELSTECFETFWEMYSELYRNSAKQNQGIVEDREVTIIKGGNSTLVNALAKSIDNRVHYHQVLKKIEKNAEGQIVLTFNDNIIVPTDYLILAIPFSTLRDVSIQEGLFPEDQLHAVKTMAYATNAKVLLPTKFEHDDFARLALIEDFFVWFDKSDHVMTLYYGGTEGVFDPSLEGLKAEIEKACASLHIGYCDIQYPFGIVPAKLVDRQDITYTKPVAISWINEEFSKGSYSCIGKDQAKMFNEMSQEFGQPIKKAFRSIEGKIFFAGEHTTLNVIGTLEGAVESGERTAKMVEAALDIKDYDSCKSFSAASFAS